MEEIPEYQPIIFALDSNLGKYIMAETGREAELLLRDSFKDRVEKNIDFKVKGANFFSKI